jgi:hypothetical protein
MNPGIYYVKFSSPTTSMSGEGLAVLKDGTINGGDIGYLYIGSFTVKDDTAITADLKVKRWNPAITSLFGNLPEFDLNLSGHVAADLTSFSATGGVIGRPGVTIVIKGRRLSDAA